VNAELDLSNTFTPEDPPTQKVKMTFEFKKPISEANFTKISTPVLEKKQYRISDLLDISGPENAYKLSQKTSKMGIIDRLKSTQDLKGDKGAIVKPKLVRSVTAGDIFGIVDRDLSSYLYHWLNADFTATYDMQNQIEEERSSDTTRK